MKAQRIIGILAALASLSVSRAGSPETTMEWKFSDASNPSVVTPSQANPYNGTGTATIAKGTGQGYNPGRYLEHISPILSEGYGTATGLWEILGGGVDMGINLLQASPAEPLTYRFVVNQFASGGSFPFSANVGFSLPGNPADHLISRETIQSDSAGVWLKSVYEWGQISVDGPITVTMTSDPIQGNGLLLDSMGFTVIGALIPIPEPSISQLGFVGFLVVGFASLRRRVK